LFNARAKIPQPGFAVQTALAGVSCLLGRAYRTNHGNYPSLYFVNVGKSSQGKENGKGTLEEVFLACGLPERIAGSGYTSAGAVFTALLRRPVHLAVIDELGMYLESGNTKAANSNALDANRILMEVIGRCDSNLRPTEYSEMTLRNPPQERRIVYKRALSILAMTTPGTFYDALTIKQIRSGFLGRFVIYQSFLPRVAPIYRPTVSVPDSIVAWAEKIRIRHAGDVQSIDPSQVETRANLRGLIAKHVPDIQPSQVDLSIDSGALALFRDFGEENIKLQNELEKDGGIEALVGRYPEFAMRVALICALSRDPYAQSVEQQDADWAIQYIDFCGRQTVHAVNDQMAGSDHERDRTTVLEAIRAAGAKGVTNQDMRRVRPFASYDNLKLNGIIKELTEGRLIDSRNVSTTRQGGRPRIAYVALDPKFSNE
jgi:hypothetical protein